MWIPSNYDRGAQWMVPIPQRLDGSGVVKLRMSLGGIEHFGLDKFPSPKDYGRPHPSGQGRVINVSPKRGGANQGSFRLAYDWADGRTKPVMVRFRLGSDWRMETLQVLTNFLIENYPGWFEIRNEHGNNVWRGYFSSDGARLRGRACS